MYRRVYFSIKSILIVVVILLGAIPLILLGTIINKTVRENTFTNTKLQTRGILNQSQKYLNLSLEHINNFSEDLIKNKELLEILTTDHISQKSVSLIKNAIDNSPYNINLAILDLDTDNSSVIFNSNYPEGLVISSKNFVSFYKSQSVILLKENRSRVLWLGKPPSIDYGLSPSIWCYRILNTKQGSFVLALSMYTDILTYLLKDIETSTLSEVRLITTDNSIYPYDPQFFNYKFSAKSLSRSEKGRFISFTDSRQKIGIKENLLIHIYSDPIYFYNLVVLTPEKHLLRGFDTVSRTTVITLTILSIFSIGFGIVSTYFLKKRITQFIKAVKDVSIGKYDISLTTSKIKILENEKLTKAIRNMARDVSNTRQKLDNLNEELEDRVNKRTRELEKTYKELNLTRNSLINSEKMALLGKNAAKITHEINNALGISITASSHLSILINEIVDKVTNQKISKSEFMNLASSAEDISNIIENNLTKASELSTNFKKIASDQSSNELRNIKICDYIKEIIHSYSFKLKRNKHQIKLNYEKEIEIETYPAIIYQTITNLINNSLLHGFDNTLNGIIEVDILDEEKCLKIIYKDNGKGISENDLERLYEPFFTTKPNQGGTGLGLNIIKDLINSKLKGTIDCSSTLDEGVTFTIILPKGEIL